jgi:hypothetical protein
MMACKAYRDYARDIKGIECPNIVASITAHSGIKTFKIYINNGGKKLKFFNWYQWGPQF